MNRPEDRLYSFVFRGELARAALKGVDLGANERMQGQLPETSPLLALMRVEVVDESERMAGIFRVIWSFENSVREFIEKLLLEEVGEDWWSQVVPEKRRRSAEKRKEEEDKIRWHSARGERMLDYTLMEDLSSIISTNQDIFLPYLTSIEWSKNVFKTVEASRNILMHSGSLESEDVARLVTVIRDWLNQVGG